MKKSEYEEALDKQLELDLAAISDILEHERHRMSPKVQEMFEQTKVQLKEAHCHKVCEYRNVDHHIDAASNALEQRFGKLPTALLLMVLGVYHWLKHTLVPIAYFKEWRRSRKERLLNKQRIQQLKQQADDLRNAQ